MTGRHTGHARVRGNAKTPLAPSDETVAEVCKKAGYATGLFGKWGLGDADTTGAPMRKGFDQSFGFLDQTHAHNYYPDHLWRNGERVPLGNVVAHGVATKRVEYAPDLLIEAALDFMEKHRDEPFFLYFATTLPHANNEAKSEGTRDQPSDEPYSDRDWPPAQRGHAAMITRLDRDTGRLLDRLASLGIDDRTIVFFTSDNGPHTEGGAKLDFFDDGGPLRGSKRDLYEGGIRVPMIVRYSGHIAAGQTNNQPWAFWDVPPTVADIVHVAPPADIDGVSMWPTIVGASAAGHEQAPHGPFYWEFHERGFTQAARKGPWKAVRNRPARTELYDLTNDLGETRDVSAEHPEIVDELSRFMAASHVPSPDWPTPAEKAAVNKK